MDSLILGEFESQYWIKRIDEAHKVPNTNIVSLRTIERQKGQTIGFVIVSVLGGVWGYRSAYQLSVEMEGGDSARHKKAGRTIGATSALLSGFLIGAPIGKSIGWKTVYMLNDTTSTQ
ncbi:hypothetical protein KAR48_12905 [bacterium]|nr:hypothetical protein [bacterium]